MIYNIITHAGLFHADEVFAIALLKKFYPIGKIEREHGVTNKQLKSKTTFVLDRGGEYNPAFLNFDHHQNEKLESTNVLVLVHLLGERKISRAFYDHIINNFLAISKIDRGVFSDKSGEFFHVNSLIKSFNFIEDGWELALKVAEGYVESAVNHVKEIEISKTIWERRNKISPHVVEVEGFPVDWKNYKEEELMIKYDKFSDLWQLHSRDTEKYPIKDNQTAVYLHSTKFFAVYNSREEAVEAAIFSSK